MASDELRELIARARSAMPDIPEQAWIRFEEIVREHAGGREIYIRANRKARHLDRLASLDGTVMREIDRSIEIGISDRRLRQLRALTR